ncbi:unnamed protein product [Closterium sp. NIES-64]|nr:unnamed protein product [Closterium sp. NIES-64]
MSRFVLVSVAVALCLLATLPVKSANPLQDGLEKLTAGLRSNKYHYAGFQAKLRQHQMNRLRNDAKTFVKRQAAHKMALYIGLYTTIICVMRGRDSKGNKIGQDRAFGFYFILVYKRNDGDFDAHYGGFVKVREPGYPIAAVINTGYEGEDGSTVIDFGDQHNKWHNLTRTISLGIVSWFPKSPAPLGYNYVFRGSWDGIRSMTAADGSNLFDAIEVLARTTQKHYGLAANTNYPSGVIRGQCGIDSPCGRAPLPFHPPPSPTPPLPPLPPLPRPPPLT